jgi:hypothetical protein
MVVAQQWLVGMWDVALAAFADAVDEAAREQRADDVPIEDPGEEVS